MANFYLSYKNYIKRTHFLISKNYYINTWKKTNINLCQLFTLILAAKWKIKFR